VLFIWFLLRRRRTKLEFDGNFDPAHVTSKRNEGYGGATLPRMDLADEEMLEDDGMGGRLGAGAGGGGIISPYAYQPPVPVAATAMASGAAPVQQRHQRNPSYGQPQQQQQYYDSNNPPASPVTSGMSSEGGYQPTHHTTSSGSHYPYVNPMGRGPSPGPSVLTGNGQGSSEHSSAGISASAYGGIAGAGVMLGQYGNEQQQQQRSAKEMEAMGMRAPRVMNPDEAAAAAAAAAGGGGGGGGYYPTGVHPQSRQAYLQHGPMASSGSQQQFYQAVPSAVASSGVPDALRPGPQSQPHSHYPSASMASTSPSPPPTVLPGSAVVVHQDGGRVVMRKGGQVEEEEEEGLAEIPPTYDSLLHGGSSLGASAPSERRE